MDIIVSVDASRQMKNFVQMFYSDTEDDMKKCITNIAHCYELHAGQSRRDNYIFDMFLIFLEECAYKW